MEEIIRNFEKRKDPRRLDFTDTDNFQMQWDVTVNDGYDFIERVPGFDAAIAAEEYLERNFSEWGSPDEIEIWVKKPTDIKWQKFNVIVSPIPAFTATPL